MLFSSSGQNRYKPIHVGLTMKILRFPNNKYVFKIHKPVEATAKTHALFLEIINYSNGVYDQKLVQTLTSDWVVAKVVVRKLTSNGFISNTLVLNATPNADTFDRY